MLKFKKNKSLCIQGFEGPKQDRDKLMASWQDRWNKVRKNWSNHTKEYEEKKHGVNMAILEALYKK